MASIGAAGVLKACRVRDPTADFPVTAARAPTNSRRRGGRAQAAQGDGEMCE